MRLPPACPLRRFVHRHDAAISSHAPDAVRVQDSIILSEMQ